MVADFTERFPNLYQFLSAYFTQDWKELYDWQEQSPNFEEVVRYYKTTNSPPIVYKTSQELQSFLNLSLGLREFERVLRDEFMVWHTPRSRGMNKKQWLEAVLGVLQESGTQSKLRLIR
jgi:hypothetical protein